MCSFPFTWVSLSFITITISNTFTITVIATVTVNVTFIVIVIVIVSVNVIVIVIVIVIFCVIVIVTVTVTITITFTITLSSQPFECAVVEGVRRTKREREVGVGMEGGRGIGGTELLGFLEWFYLLVQRDQLMRPFIIRGINEVSLTFVNPVINRVGDR